MAVDNFTEECRKVYFATDDYSLMTWGVVNGGLYFLFQEKASLAEGAQRAQFLEYQSLCRDNLETALANLPLLMPARKESVEVLLMGVRARLGLDLVILLLRQKLSNYLYYVLLDGKGKKKKS